MNKKQIIYLMRLIPLNIYKFQTFVKLLILRYQFIGITLTKPHLLCTFYDKQINAKKYEWKFGSVQILLVGNCILIILKESYSSAFQQTAAQLFT